MNVRRNIRRAIIVLLITAVFTVALLYGLADRIPSAYREAQQRVIRLAELNEQAERENREGPRRHFLKVYGDFSKYGGAGKPFEFQITADEINLCLVSMDQIASLNSPKPVYATAKLTKAGFRGPLVSMDDGVLTLMVKSTRHDKIISVDLKFVFDGQGDMRMEIFAIRIGVLPVPVAMLENQIQRLRGKLQNLLGRTNNNGDGSFAASTKNVARLLRAVVDMLDAQSVRPEVTWKDNNVRHPLLITDMVINDGTLTLHFDPILD